MEKPQFEFKQINPRTYVGGIPPSCELVIGEKEGDSINPLTALTLYGFDELYEFDGIGIFKNPVWGFLKWLDEEES